MPALPLTSIVSFTILTLLRIWLETLAILVCRCLKSLIASATRRAGNKASVKIEMMCILGVIRMRINRWYEEVFALLPKDLSATLQWSQGDFLNLIITTVPSS